MLRRWIPILSVAAVVLASAEPASAALRDRWMNRRGGYSYAPVYSYEGMQTTTVMTPDFVPMTGQPVYSGPTTRRFFGRTSPGYYSTPAPMAGTTTTQPTQPGRTSFYAGGAPNNTVVLNIRLPADAELRIEGQKMALGGPTRQVFSPPLDPNREYTYDLQAKWLENGKEVSKTRTVTFKPGKALDVNFLAPDAHEKHTP
jgi:uncharacterized protein (TIGR03000 family)